MSRSGWITTGALGFPHFLLIRSYTGLRNVHAVSIVHISAAPLPDTQMDTLGALPNTPTSDQALGYL